MSKNITVTVKPDGTTSVEANGFNGVGCTDATRSVEMALAGPAGASETDRNRKPEFYQSLGGTNRNMG